MKERLVKFVATIEIIGFEGTLTFESEAKDEDEFWDVLKEQIEQIKMNDCTVDISSAFVVTDNNTTNEY